MSAAIPVVIVAVLARFALPPLLDRMARLRSRELFTMLAVLLVMGSAVAADALGLTLAVGAFVGGLVLSASPWAHQLFAEVLPLRGLLLGIFFTAVGMLFDPSALTTPLPIAGSAEAGGVREKGAPGRTIPRSATAVRTRIARESCTADGAGVNPEVGVDLRARRFLRCRDRAAPAFPARAPASARTARRPGSS